MKTIALRNGGEAIVDDEDYHALKPFRWYAITAKTGAKYVYSVEKIDGKRVGMHRVILDAPNGLDVDHINFNCLDNRRENLRLCTRAENLRNRRKRAGTTSSQYKGVSLKRWRGYEYWEASIKRDKKSFHIGYFPEERWAAMAYDIAAKDLFRDFAQTNF